MTSIPIDRPAHEPDPTVVDLPTTRVRAQARAHAPVHGGALEPVRDTSPLRFDRTAVLDLVRPPDVWSDERPSLRSQWLYSVYGPWTGEATLGRRLGVAYAALVALPATALGYLLLWLVERPSRAAVAGLIAVLTYFAFLSS
jgi:hypothetical protein